MYLRIQANCLGRGLRCTRNVVMATRPVDRLSHMLAPEMPASLHYTGMTSYCPPACLCLYGCMYVYSPVCLYVSLHVHSSITSSYKVLCTFPRPFPRRRRRTTRKRWKIETKPNKMRKKRKKMKFKIKRSRKKRRKKRRMWMILIRLIIG